MAWDVFTYSVVLGGERRDVVSPVDGRWLFDHGYGLAPTAIFGVLLRLREDGGGIEPENFRQNRPCVDVLHEVVAAEAPRTRATRRQAKRQGGGYLYMLDGRTPDPEGTVPGEDIIGAFSLRDGGIVPGSYQPNPQHKLLTAGGFFVLPPELEGALMDRMRADCARGGPPAS